MRLVNIGMARSVDGLGRVVIPKEMRQQLNINTSDLMGISLEDGKIILEPCRLQCVFCGCREESTLRERNGILACEECIKALPDAEKAFVDQVQPAS